MGYHVCVFCSPATKAGRFSKTSSGDVNLTFANGRRWVMPDMALHYIADHGWQPPQEFINDVMNENLANSGRAQTRGGMDVSDVLQGERIGYLSGSYEQGYVPLGFIERLEQLMRQASDIGYRIQTKGAALEQPLKILVTRRSNDCHACLEGLPGIWGCGRTPDEAVGALLRAHQGTFEITIKF